MTSSDKKNPVPQARTCLPGTYEDGVLHAQAGARIPDHQVVPTRPAPAAPGSQPEELPVLVHNFLPSDIAVRTARVLAVARVAREVSTGDAGYQLGRVQLDGGGFDLDRWWAKQVFDTLGSPGLLAWLHKSTGIDPGIAVDLGAHVLGPGDYVGWHDDRGRGQRLGFVWFASDPAPAGGRLMLAPISRPRFVAPSFNSLVVFDAAEPHAVEQVQQGVRRTIIGRTRAIV